MSSDITQKFRRTVRPGILAVGVAVITIAGAWYGAGLKMQTEEKQARLQVYEQTVPEKIAQLQELRSSLVSQRTILEHKINQLQKRQEQKNKIAEEASRYSAGGNTKS